MKKMFKVTALLVGGEASDDIDVCVCESYELAQNIVDKLTMEHEKRLNIYNDYGWECSVGRMDWDSPDDKDAIEALNQMNKFECPFKKDIKLEKCTCGYEITCKGHSYSCDYQNDYTFIISEINSCDKIEDVEFDY